jgi:hypothetical protein
MGAPGISDEELDRLGIEVVHRAGSGIRGLLVPGAGLEAYKDLVREKLEPGFWNDIVGRDEIFFLFKWADGGVEEFTYSSESREEIARRCTELNEDPIERTSDLPRYLAANPFYRDLMLTFHGVADP